MRGSICSGTTTCRPSKIEGVEIEGIARVCHEANRAYARVLGDRSHLPWEAAPAWQRESALEGVKHALRGATPEQLHESWLAAKAADGWVYGPTKDEGLKTHPCFLPYEELPPEQQRKDALFRAVVTALR
jgi:RyR domain-containing protein